MAAAAEPGNTSSMPPAKAGKFAPGNVNMPFVKSVDTGPMDYKDMDPGMAETIQHERIRRQVEAHLAGVTDGKTPLS